MRADIGEGGGKVHGSGMFFLYDGFGQVMFFRPLYVLT